MKYFTPQELSDKQSLTPEGFLLCRDVPIARTGRMLYADYEMPNVRGRNGLVQIERDESVVFDPRTIASFEGKPVTDDHPEGDVTPENWQQLAVGVVQNVRRGLGLYSDLLLADLLITEKNAIQAVRDGKREVSCGYDAEYEEIEPGRGRPTSITGNHVALVNRGRCGSRCSIQDKDGVSKMSKIKDRILAAFTLGDKTALTKTLDELPNDDATSQQAAGGVHIHVNDKQPEQKTQDANTLDADAIKKLIADGIAEALKAAKTKDADEEEKCHEGHEKSTSDSDEDDDKTYDAAAEFKELVSRAEILAPGFEVQKLTTDAESDKKKARDAICACKRRVLDAAFISASGQRKEALKPLLAGVDLSKKTRDSIDALFVSASELVRHINNAKAAPGTKTADANTIDAHSRGGMDAINREFWKKQNA